MAAAAEPAALTGKNARCMARSENAPVMIMPAATATVSHGYFCQRPITTEISATNPLKPGKPIEAAVARVNPTAAPGSVFHKSNA